MVLIHPSPIFVGSGTVVKNGEKVIMTKKELEQWLSEPVAKPFDLSVFQSIVNGVFKAEGHWGGYFTSLTTVHFRPLWFISQMASSESVLFFGQLKAVLGPGFTYYLYLNSSGQWHIRLQCRNWPHILNICIPYLNQLYGPKFIGMQHIIAISILAKINTVIAKIEIIVRAY